jgi:anti-anti-sigma factor
LSVTADLVSPHTVVITARGDVDMATSPLLQARLHEWIRRPGPALVVDLTGVRFFGAAGVTVLVRAAESAKTAGVEFLVVAAGRVVLLPLRITGLRDALVLCPTLSQALERCAAAGSPPPL